MLKTAYYRKQNTESVWSDCQWIRRHSPMIYPVQTVAQQARIYTISDQALEGICDIKIDSPKCEKSLDVIRTYLFCKRISFVLISFRIYGPKRDATKQARALNLEIFWPITWPNINMKKSTFSKRQTSLIDAPRKLFYTRKNIQVKFPFSSEWSVKLHKTLTFFRYFKKSAYLKAEISWNNLARFIE